MVVLNEQQKIDANVQAGQGEGHCPPSKEVGPAEGTGQAAEGPAAHSHPRQHSLGGSPTKSSPSRRCGVCPSQPHLPCVFCGVIEAMGSRKLADTAKGLRKWRQRARTPHELWGKCRGGGELLSGRYRKTRWLHQLTTTRHQSHSEPPRCQAVLGEASACRQLRARTR